MYRSDQSPFFQCLLDAFDCLPGTEPAVQQTTAGARGLPVMGWTLTAVGCCFFNPATNISSMARAVEVTGLPRR
ncbi:hypothetical protein NDU88_005699 [Pleurodeles waltl]|uniref:Uncharacterized protein n=1 Tax=Pleurodeles waltl TaxID=8319 RepID=A0AAV7VMQ7_PLEWA|nr:hypothetical protein NDU88_005699 [Pleurodeles waltl]